MVNGYEIKRVIAFANRVRERFRANLPFSEPDPHWNIISHLIQMYLEGRPVSISGLVQVSNLPYGTATRRIHEMLDAGLIVRQARSATGKSFHLLPSASLLENFESYAREIKMELARVYGQAGVDDGDNYYFGGDHQRLAFNEEQLIEVKNIVGVEGVRDFFSITTITLCPSDICGRIFAEASVRPEIFHFVPCTRFMVKSSRTRDGPFPVTT